MASTKDRLEAMEKKLNVRQCSVCGLMPAPVCRLLFYSLPPRVLESLGPKPLHGLCLCLTQTNYVALCGIICCLTNIGNVSGELIGSQ